MATRELTKKELSKMDELDREWYYLQKIDQEIDLLHEEISGRRIFTKKVQTFIVIFFNIILLISVGLAIYSIYLRDGIIF